MSKPRKIRIIREYDDHDPIVLGTIIGGSCYTKKVAIRLVNDAWDEFQATEPNSDTDFIKYMTDKPNWSLFEEDDSIDLVVG